jgi:hypothetical protein
MPFGRVGLNCGEPELFLVSGLPLPIMQQSLKTLIEYALYSKHFARYFFYTYLI